MKNNYYLLLIAVFCVQIFYAQTIRVNNAVDPESSLSAPQMVEDVLIDSDCVTIQWDALQDNNTNDLTQRSWGYFNRGSSSFPFEEGIVITSGNAQGAQGPNNNTDYTGSNGWAGDADLKAILDLNYGGNVNTNDATSFTFRFTPTINFMSFNFIFASDEYENQYECQSNVRDGFAFLVRGPGIPNNSGTTFGGTNIARIPGTTNVPVSTFSIHSRNFLCGTENEGFNWFPELYRSNSALNNTNVIQYDGFTDVLTASTAVIPGQEYVIKIVLADRGDTIVDSAVFIEAGSFNIGGNLGGDQTIANGNPGCDGTPIILDATSGAGATYTWFLDGVELVGETNPTLSATVDGVYRVEVELAAGCISIDEVELEFTTPPVIDRQPEDILMCETDGNGIEVFDFTNNASLVLGSQVAADFPISFHATQANAEGNLSPIINFASYSNVNPNETIWIRIADATQTCYEVTSFDISVVGEPIANQPVDYEQCDNADDGDDTNGVVTFDLSTKAGEVLGAQSAADFTVTFYLTPGEATAGVAGTEITAPIQNTSNPQPIYARIENNTNPACFNTVSFDLVVNPRPVVTPVVQLLQCDDDTDGFSSFNLTEANVLISTNSANETFTYYLTQAQAMTGLVADQITNFTTYPNPTAVNSTVYARVETAAGCYRTAQIDLVVSTTLIPAGFNLAYEVCDDDLVDNDNTNGVAAFDFSDATAQILALYPPPQNLVITYYENETDALAEQNAIPDISNHRNDASPFTQNIYVRVDSDDNNACLGLGHHITLTVDPLPLANPVTDYILCSDTNQAVFDLTTKDAEVLGAQTQAILISYHLTEQDAIDNIPIAGANAFTNTTNPQTIYVRAQFDDNGNGVGDAGECFNTDMNFDLIVNPNPEIFTPDPIRICSDQVDTVYDLTIRADQIRNGDTSITLAYYESAADVTANNPITTPMAYTNTILTRDIIVVATGTNTCTSTVDLRLETILYANLNLTPAPIEECEVDNDGFDSFDITRREEEILNGLLPTDFTFTYYLEEADAIAGNANIITETATFVNTVAVMQTIYVRVDPNGNECFQVIPLTLIVNPVPEIQIEDEYVICLAANGGLVTPGDNTFLPVPPIDTQLSPTEYTFQWYEGTEALPENILPGATDPSYSPIAPGQFTVVATNIATGCTIPGTTTVIGSYPPESISVEVVTNAFADSHTLEVSVVGSGDYEYRLDFGPWQQSTTFEDVTRGEHLVYVRDLFNCDELVSEIKIVIDFPKFFTPNGDGFNDTWNITGINTIPSAKIYIFDRFGKLLKQLSPTNGVWDGTFNGNPLPASDYWFRVIYTEDGAEKEFKGHFTLKR